MPISDWAELFTSTIQYRASMGADTYGVPQYSGEPTNYKARIVESPKRVVSRITGEDVLANTAIWIQGVIDPFKADDEITLPNGTKPKILSWSIFPDENGPHHMKVFVQQG